MYSPRRLEAIHVNMGRCDLTVSPTRPCFQRAPFKLSTMRYLFSMCPTSSGPNTWIPFPLVSKLGSFFLSFFSFFFFQHALLFGLLVLWMGLQCSKKQDRFLFPFHELPRDQLPQGWGFFFGRGGACCCETGTMGNASQMHRNQRECSRICPPAAELGLLPLVLWLRNGVQGIPDPILTQARQDCVGRTGPASCLGPFLFLFLH